MELLQVVIDKLAPSLTPPTSRANSALISGNDAITILIDRNPPKKEIELTLLCGEVETQPPQL
jgi:hypothetical protein